MILPQTENNTMANMPKGTELRTELLRIKATPTERALIQEAARLTGKTQSDFLREAAQKALNALALTLTEAN